MMKSKSNLLPPPTLHLSPPPYILEGGGVVVVGGRRFVVACGAEKDHASVEEARVATISLGPPTSFLCSTFSIL